MKFKVGDKVISKANGKVGIIKSVREADENEEVWCSVFWITGSWTDAYMNWCNSSTLEHYGVKK